MPIIHVLVQYVLLPDCLIKNSVPAILAQISKVLLTRDRRPCRIVNTRPITRTTRNDAILLHLTRRIDNGKGKSTYLVILESENHVTNDRRAHTLRDLLIRFFVPFAPFFHRFYDVSHKIVLVEILSEQFPLKSALFSSPILHSRLRSFRSDVYNNITNFFSNCNNAQYNVNIRMVKLMN